MNLHPHIPSSSYAIDPRLQAYVLLNRYRGMSNESKIIAKVIENIPFDRENPKSIDIGVFDNSAAWKKALSELANIRRSCTADDWDNAGSVRIVSQTIENAQYFIERAPNYLPLPEISPEPDGNINLEWYVDSNFVFEISVGQDKTLFYAGRLRGKKISGRESLANEFPEIFESFIRRFVRQ